MGSNDYHFEDGELLNGLGADEPDPHAKERARADGEKALLALKAEVAAASGELTAKQREQLVTEQAQAERAAEFEAREQALAKREAELAAASTPTVVTPAKGGK